MIIMVAAAPSSPACWEPTSYDQSKNNKKNNKHKSRSMWRVGCGIFEFSIRPKLPMARERERNNFGLPPRFVYSSISSRASSFMIIYLCWYMIVIASNAACICIQSVCI